MTKINRKPIFVHAAANKEESLGNSLGSDRSESTDRTAPLYREILRTIH